MNVDRMAELKRARAQSGRAGAAPDEPLTLNNAQSAAIAEHTAHYAEIKADLAIIRENVSKIEKLKEKSRKTADDKSRKEIMADLDEVMNETTGKGTRIKRRLDMLKAENEKFAANNKNSAQAQIHQNLYQTHIRRFHQCMTEYNEASTQFKQALKERTRRQLKIVGKDLNGRDITDDEIERIVESGRAQDFIKQAIICEDLEDVVRDIEERHQGIMKLEQQVLEVYELFRDLATLVDMQQESLDVISNRVAQAKNYTESAEIELGKAEVFQKKARKRQCCFIMVVLVVLIIVLWSTLGSESSNS